VTTAVVGGRRATSPGATLPSMYMRTTWTAAGSPLVDDGGRRAKVGDCSLDDLG
jgi:hypothetical protein